MTEPKVVLCFGDSNTFGRKILRKTRYPRAERWTTYLQGNLGDDYYVIAEGLGGRTVDREDPEKPFRKGLDYFGPCVVSHEPDVVVIMLGSNDLKVVFNKNAEQIAKSLEQYIHYLKMDFPRTKILIVSPMIIDPTKPIYLQELATIFDEEKQRKSVQLVDELQKIAYKNKVYYLDANHYVRAGDDGIHWGEGSNEKFAEALAKKIEEME